DGVHRTSGPIDAIAAQLSRRLGQLRQVQRYHAAALDTAAAGPLGKKRKAHARPLAENPAKCAGCRLPGRDRRIFVMNSGVVADREGFEPSIELPLYTRSRRAPSTTRPPVHSTWARMRPGRNRRDRTDGRG